MLEWIRWIHTVWNCVLGLNDVPQTRKPFYIVKWLTNTYSKYLWWYVYIAAMPYLSIRFSIFVWLNQYPSHRNVLINFLPYPICGGCWHWFSICIASCCQAWVHTENLWRILALYPIENVHAFVLFWLHHHRLWIQRIYSLHNLLPCVSERIREKSACHRNKIQRKCKLKAY